MGIPSPLHTPNTTPLLKLKQLSPELPLQVVQEDDQDSKTAYELLPPPSVDLAASCEVLTSFKSGGAWADANSDDGSDSGDEQDSKSKESTELPRTESLESRSTVHSEPKAQNLESRVESPSPSISVRSGDILQAKGVTEVEMSSQLSADTVDTDGNGFLLPLLCRIWREDGGGMSIVPCTGDDVAADGEFDVFWCYVQQQEEGALLTPCTDAATCGIDVDAAGNPLASTEEVLGAPKRPLQDSHVPTWIYGPQSPYCSAPTTLVLNNLPGDLLQEDLIEILDKEDFSGFYDFLYLPADCESGRNLGYAIVNLTRHDYGLALSALMHGRTSWCGTSTAACQVAWSLPVQGLKQLIEHYRNHPANQESVPQDMRPAYFSGGWPRPFPPAESQ